MVLVRLAKREEMWKSIFSRKFALFGAGKCAGYFLDFLADGKEYPEVIYVSKASENPKTYYGVAVKELDNEADFSEMPIIIAVRENLQKEIISYVQNAGFCSVYTISDSLFFDLQNAYEQKHKININTDLNKLFEKNKKQLLRFIQKPCLEYMIVNILDHCNLRCKGCDHFACIADENFFSYKMIHSDLKRMAEIFDGDYILKIAVMGGEPLLHPELKLILADVRRYFPYTIIRLTTNGILLMQQDEDFWRVCRENDVTIVNTKYPLKLDYKGIQEKAKQEQVKFQFFEGSDRSEGKQSFKKVINLNGDSNPVDSFSKCHISNYGNFLLDGKFYGCPFSAQSYRIFNQKFNQNLRMYEDDYIDIYKTNDKNDFFKFAARPKYYCRYCSGLVDGIPWTTSRQEISEWVNCEKDI